MITLARELRGLSQHNLAEKINVTQGYLSRVEKGFVDPTDDFIDNLARGLKLPSNFFYRIGDTFTPNLYYRKRSRTSRSVLNKAEAEMNLHRLNIQELLDSVDIETPALPKLDIDSLGGPENTARKLRQLWNIPKGPIKELFKLIEQKGIIIILCNFESIDIDGRSMFTSDGQALIFLNSMLPMDRQRYTLCHELCHIICHMHSSESESNDTEKEANRFAAEFLVPCDELRRQIITTLTISTLADLKRYWRVSMAMLMYHSKLAKIITDRRYKSLIIEMGRRGLRTKEPTELLPPKEIPKVLSTLILVHKRDLGYTDEEIGKLLKLNSDELKYRYYENNGGNNNGNKKLKLVI